MSFFAGCESKGFDQQLMFWVIFIVAWLCAACFVEHDPENNSVVIDASVADAADDDGETDDTGSDSETGSGTDSANPVNLVGIYDDTQSADPAAWPEGLDLIEAALALTGIEFQRFDRELLNREAAAELSQYRLVIFGGGYAYPGYTLRINQIAKTAMRDFVQRGGVFVGVCAGAYFACDSLIYDGNSYDDESGYDLDLYDGVCYGPAAEVESSGWVLLETGFPGHPSYVDFSSQPFANTLWYGGGPCFKQQPDNAEILATYLDADPDCRDTPAVVSVPYGKGRVLLFGLHSEMDSGGATSSNPFVLATVVQWHINGGR